MTSKTDLIDNIHTLASLNGEEFCKSVTTSFGRELTHLTGELLPGKEDLKKNLKLDLKIIEGRLQSSGGANNALSQEILKTVQQILLFLKTPSSSNCTFNSVISQKIVKSIDFDGAVFKGLLTTVEPDERARFHKETDEPAGSIQPVKKQPFIAVVNNELVLSPALRKILTDHTLEKILSQSMLTDVTHFDFSSCPLLSPRAPLMIKKALKKLDRAQFACLNNSQFCNAVIAVDGSKIPVNREFLFDQCGYFQERFGANETTLTLAGYSADLIRDFVSYLTGEKNFVGKKQVARLLEIAQVSKELSSSKMEGLALHQICNTLESLYDETENVSYSWLSDINKRTCDLSLSVTQKLRTLAYQKVKNSAWKDNTNRYVELQKEVASISEYQDFPDISDICERLKIELALDRQIDADQTKFLPYPAEIAEFLKLISEKYPKNYTALNLLGKLEYVAWQNKAADRSNAMHYFEQIPMSFAVQNKSLKWQNNLRGADATAF